MAGSSTCAQEASYRIEKVVDARGLSCPGPVLLLSTEIRDLPSGSAVAVIARDPAFEEDIKSWAAFTGNRLLKIERRGEEILALIVKR